jgi:ABC-2 type transport system permease protein
MFGRIYAIIRKEFRQTFRDPRMKSMIFVAPLVQVIIFGYAATTDVNHIPTAVYDLDKGIYRVEIFPRQSVSLQ